MERILKPLQKMYIILCLAESMKDECTGKEELKSDYQIHSRIYANAFASMIRYGTQLACETRDRMVFLTMELEERIFSCPARTIKNIMKVDFASVEEKLPEIMPLIREEEASLLTESKNSRKQKKQENAENTTEQFKAKPVPHVFKRKQVLETLNGESQTRVVPDAEPEKSAMKADRLAGTIADTVVKSSFDRFSRFLPKNKKQKVLDTMPSLQPKQMETETVPNVIAHVDEEKHGERICHTHYVMLKKTYGTQVTDPYVIQIWPTEVIEMCSDRMPSAIFVRAQAPNGTVISKVNEGCTKYIVLNIDNKQFNVFGYWEAGKFVTEISPINKTASIYTMIEEVEQECPEQVSDLFLDQFRSREPHHPEFFVMPIENNIPNRGTVPIAAFIRIKDKNYLVNSKGNKNTLRFTYEGQLSEISGWWEDGRFVFAVRAVEEE